MEVKITITGPKGRLVHVGPVNLVSAVGDITRLIAEQRALYNRNHPEDSPFEQNITVQPDA